LKFNQKKLRFFWLGLGIMLGLLAVSTLSDLWYFPEHLKLTPGQRITLGVHYPLAFYPGKNFHFPAAGIYPKSDAAHLLTRHIVLDSKGNAEFEVQLRLFGAIPVKTLRVKVVEPPLVIPGGQAIGVLFSSHGVVIVGHLPVKGVDQKTHYPAREAGLEVGDIILSINNIPVNRVNEVEVILRNYQPVVRHLYLTIKRRSQLKTIAIQPVLCRQEGGKATDRQEFRYMLGIFVEDPAAGVGTLTFYDPITKRFAGLGHHIAEFPGVKGLSFQQGEIVNASINGIKIGTPGEPGEKIGVCNSSSSVIGRIERNNRFGIYGQLYSHFFDPLVKPVPIAYSSQIKEGPAEIYTVIRGRQVEKFTIEIIKVFQQNEPRDKGMIIRVTDPVLLKHTGGIIQGMSGSPIIQNGRLVGAVTHVFVNDPTRGYGVLAEWMNNEINYQTASEPRDERHKRKKTA
jgi:stage IV sporulation protein B